MMRYLKHFENADDVVRACELENFFNAINEDNCAEVKRMLRIIPELINIRNLSNKTPIMNANSAKMLQILLDHGANPEAQDDDGWKFIHFTSTTGNVELLKTLLLHGVDVNSKTKTGFTALMGTAVFMNFESMKLLLSFGAKYYIRDAEGKTFYDWADRGAEKRGIEIRKWIEENYKSLVTSKKFGL